VSDRQIGEHRPTRDGRLQCNDLRLGCKLWPIDEWVP
jgi:hypothetical protein